MTQISCVQLERQGVSGALARIRRSARVSNRSGAPQISMGRNWPHQRQSHGRAKRAVTKKKKIEHSVSHSLFGKQSTSVKCLVAVHVAIKSIQPYVRLHQICSSPQPKCSSDVIRLTIVSAKILNTFGQDGQRRKLCNRTLEHIRIFWANTIRPACFTCRRHVSVAATYFDPYAPVSPSLKRDRGRFARDGPTLPAKKKQVRKSLSEQETACTLVPAQRDKKKKIAPAVTVRRSALHHEIISSPSERQEVGLALPFTVLVHASALGLPPHQKPALKRKVVRLRRWIPPFRCEH